MQLKHRNIAAVVNCDSDLFGLAKEKEVRYLKIDPCIDDDDLQKCTDHPYKAFEIAFKFLEQELEGGHNVLVHCEKGITKSASIVIYFLMKKLDVSLASAYREVKKYREVVLPHPSLFRHLVSAELTNRGVDTIRIQGKSVIFLEKKTVENGRTVSETEDSSSKYFIGGVLVSLVVALVIGLYAVAGKF